MVLGFVLYESIDLAYNVLKLGYNGISGVYNWYYYEPEEESSREQEILIEMTNLMSKLEELQKELKVKNIPEIDDIENGKKDD
jgi:hypothetical protein